MNGNPKSLLLEALQARGLPLPTFVCRRIGGPDHAPLWVATATVPRGCGAGSYSSDASQSKTAAEREAARAALEAVRRPGAAAWREAPAWRERPAPPRQVPAPPRAVVRAPPAPPQEARAPPAAPPAHGAQTYVLIDVENMGGPTNRILKIMADHVPPRWRRATFLFCMSRNCPLVAKVKACVAHVPRAEVAVTECRDSNAADVLICIIAARADREDRVILMSNDRLIHTLARVRSELYANSSCVTVSDVVGLNEQLVSSATL
jgi:hypothetical protein